MMENASERTIEVNGRGYRLPEQPTVVVCVDGCEYEYLEAAVAAASRLSSARCSKAARPSRPIA